MNRTDELNAVPALMRSGALGGEEDGVRRYFDEISSSLHAVIRSSHWAAR